MANKAKIENKAIKTPKKESKSYKFEFKGRKFESLDELKNEVGEDVYNRIHRLGRIKEI